MGWREYTPPPDTVVISATGLRLNYFLLRQESRHRLEESTNVFNMKLSCTFRPLYNVESIKIIEHAHHKKHRNPTEDVQERRNEMKRRLLRRRRSRTPLLLRCRMPEKEKMMWCPVVVTGYRSWPARYIEILKRKLGTNLKNPDTWNREHGLPYMKKTDRDLAMDGTLRYGIGKKLELETPERKHTLVRYTHYVTLPPRLHSRICSV